MPKDACHGCGACCTFQDTDGTWKPCRYLAKDKSCTIYKIRIGTHIGNDYYCGYIKNSDHDYPGCSLNRDRPFNSFYKHLEKY